MEKKEDFRIQRLSKRKLKMSTTQNVPMCQMLGCTSPRSEQRYIAMDDEWMYVIPQLMQDNEDWIKEYKK